jgi:hypothetical protein
MNRDGIVAQAVSAEITGPFPAGDAPAEVAPLLADLRAMLVRVAEVDPRPFAFAAARATLADDLAKPLDQLLEAALDILARLDSACGMSEGGSDGDDSWDLFAEESATTEDGRPSAESTVWRGVGDFCFTAHSELSRCRRQLVAATGRDDDLVVVCESVHRKLRRSLAAVLEASSRAGGLDDPLLPSREGDIEAALAVRAMYAKFRRSLPSFDLAEPSSVRRALRFAAVSLAVMFGSADFAETRISDRLMLMSLQGRILRWARSSNEATEGARLCSDIATAADLLRAINLRQELVAHDAELIDAALHTTPPGGSDDDALRSWIGDLRGLRGRDDELDGLLDHAYDGAPLAGLVPGLCTVLEQLSHRVGAGPGT